ncbi:MAG: peptidylprolyl isomerase, partial [Myxococcota bacterium]
MRLLSLITLLVIGCDEQAAEPAVPGEYTASGPVIGQVNGQPVHQDMVDVLLERIPAAQKQQMEQMGQLDQIADQILLTEALYQSAIEEGLHQDPAIQTAIALAARNALADAVISKRVEAQLTDEKIQTWYTEHLVQFAQPQVKLSHIILQDKAKADELKVQLDGGADFAQLATENTIDPRTKATGGKLDNW